MLLTAERIFRERGMNDRGGCGGAARLGGYARQDAERAERS
jgi:hypothetical protein